MIWAFGRLLLIAVVAILCICLAVFGLRLAGENQPYSDFTHPLIGGARWVIADGGDIDFGPAQSLSSLSAANALGPQVFLGLKIRLTYDGHWVLYGPSQLDELTDGTGYVLQKTLPELTRLKFKDARAESLLEVSEVFTKFPEANYYIDVLQPGASQLKSLYALIKKHRLEKHIVLTSSFTDTLANLRDEDASWLTGATVAEQAKTQFMTSIFLEPIVNLNYDVFIAKNDSPRLISELKRRKKVVIFDIDNYPKLLSTLTHYPSTGILTKRPSYFMQKVDTRAISN